ncbi:hypothetical protein [Comamonas jiangduensis]|uniref:hypothetical protein n=1 Tax=Comamonas jiangduensis TaxID=1194168 RepID=UPI0035E4168B
MSLILKVGLAICPGNRPQKKNKKLKLIEQRMVLAAGAMFLELLIPLSFETDAKHLCIAPSWQDKPLAKSCGDNCSP